MFVRFFGFKRVKTSKKFSRSYLQRRKMEKRTQKKALDYLGIPKLQEIFTTVAIVCPLYERLAVLQNVFPIILPCARKNKKEKEERKNNSDTLACAWCATSLFYNILTSSVILLLNRCTATWNLFVKNLNLRLVRYIMLVNVFLKEVSDWELSKIVFHYNCKYKFPGSSR